MTGRPASPGSSVHGVPASWADGVSTTRRSPMNGIKGASRRSETTRSRSSSEPRIASANGPGQHATRPCRGRPRSGRGPGRPVRPRTAERVWASVPVTTTAVIHPSTATCATRHASVAASSACTSSSAAGSPTRPPPSPYQLCSRMWSRSSSSRRPSDECGEGSAAYSTRSSVSSAARRSSVGGRTGVTRPTSARARSRPLVGECRRAVLEGQPQPLQRQGPPVPDQGALQVEAAERRLPRMQVGQAGAHVVARVPPISARLRQLGAHLAPQQARRDGGVLGDADPVRCVRGRPRARPDARRAGLPGAAAPPRRGDVDAFAGRRRGRRHDASRASDERPSAISAIVATASARSACTSLPWPQEAPRGPAGHRSRLGGVLAQQGARQRQLALGLVGPQAVVAVRRRGVLQRHDRLAGPAGGGEHLGAVLLADGSAHRRQGREHRAGGVHRLQGADEVAGEQAGIAEVVLGAGPTLGRVLVRAAAPPPRSGRRPPARRRPRCRWRLARLSRARLSSGLSRSRSMAVV